MKKLRKIRTYKGHETVRMQALEGVRLASFGSRFSASMLEGGFGFVQYFTDPNCRTVHDRIAGTIVVVDRPST